MKTVYQTDQDGIFMYETVANELALDPGAYNVPYGAQEVAPPGASTGKVARWNGSGWTLVEDHRYDSLWVVPTGQQYSIGLDVEIDEQHVSYPGWGPLPAWLTTVQPSQESAFG